MGEIFWHSGVLHERDDTMGPHITAVCVGTDNGLRVMVRCVDCSQLFPFNI